LASERAPAARPGLIDRVATVIATAGGAGYSPVAPGTAGTLVAVVALWLVPLSTFALLIATAVVTALGIWAGARVERAVGRKDPGVVVIDEVAGMMVSVLAVPRSVPVLVAAFFLFRFFDVVKPPPANRLQALPGGLGIMVDDLIAGAYALVVLLAARHLLGVLA
jgi:phosphatidylglycerophosphatase A